MVECKGGLRSPGERVAYEEAGAVGTEKQEGGHGYYAAEKCFWEERCPHLAETNKYSTGARRGKNANASVVVRGKTPPANSSPATQVAAPVAAADGASYDYFSAEAAYRSSPPRHRKSTDHPDYLSAFGDNDEQVGGGKGGRRRRQRKRITIFEEGGDDGNGGSLNNVKCDAPKRSPPPPPPTRRAARGSETKRCHSLRDAETVLSGVLESVEGRSSNEDDCTRMATMAEVCMDGVVAVKYLDDYEHGRVVVLG